MTNTLKAGVVGTGFIGPVHVEALRRLGVEVAGIVGSNSERAAPKAQALGVRLFASYDEMLRDASISVVHITTPNHLHFEQVRAALTAGKHVVCEKPLATTRQESAELIALAAKLKRINAVNFNIRYYPLVLQARSMVQSGEIGDVFVISGSYMQDWLLYDTDWNWRLEPEYSGNMRAVSDIGSHWLDLVTFVCGRRIEAVCADFSTFLPVRRKPARAIETFTGKLTQAAETIPQKVNTEDYATVLLRFEGGARGVVSVSQVSAGRKNRLAFEINGSKASVAWESERPNQMWVGHRERPNELLLKDPALLSPQARQHASYPGGHDEGFPDTFKQLYAAIYGYIAKGDFTSAPTFPTFADGHYEMLLSESIFRSAKEERWVRVQAE